MKIHEYQAKAILAAYGIPVPPGEVAQTPDAVAAIAQRLGGRVVVKAQIHAGGRGQGGGVKLADTPAQAAEVGAQILGMTLVTPQTGAEGRLVRQVLVEEALDIARELYVCDGGSRQEYRRHDRQRSGWRGHRRGGRDYA
jgi:succinyl-CoA synthetase beta subunit